MRYCYVQETDFVINSASPLKEVWECGFVLHWLQGIASTVASGRRCSICHSSPWQNHPLQFFISIAYQKAKEKEQLPRRTTAQKLRANII